MGGSFDVNVDDFLVAVRAQARVTHWVSKFKIKIVGIHDADHHAHKPTDLIWNMIQWIP